MPIPHEMNSEGTEVTDHKEGDRLIPTPVRKNALLDLLASWEPLSEGLPDIEDCEFTRVPDLRVEDWSPRG